MNTPIDHMTQIQQQPRLRGQRGADCAAGRHSSLRTSQSPPHPLRHQEQSDHQTSLSPAEEVGEGNFESQSQKDREKGWRLLAAQTNTQLLHVLCDLVQAFIDTEKQIEVSLSKLGFGDENASNSQTDSDVQSCLSLEDIIMDRSQRSTPAGHNNQHGQHVNPETGDFCDDGPDLINPASFILNPESVPRDLLNPGSGAKIDDDIVLGYSKRLRTAVDRILHLLKNVASLQFEPSSLTESAKDQHSSAGRMISKSASMPTCAVSACDHQQQIVSLESELGEARRRNRVVQEELTKKHNALSSLKAQIETQSILDAKFLKAENEDLSSKLAAAEQKIHRQAEMIRQLRSDSTHDRDDCAVIELSPERGRRTRDHSPFDLNLNDVESLPFDKSDDLLNLDELESLASERWDRNFDDNADTMRLQKGRTVDAGDGAHRQNVGGSESRLLQERESLFHRIIQEKDEEIQVLKEQMKLAQTMIASAFPEQKMDEYLDVDLIETLVDSHLKHRIPTKETRSAAEKKSRFSGVDLIEPIQDMRSANGLESPKSSSSGGQPNGLSSNESSFLEVQIMDAKISQLQTVIEKLISRNTNMQSELNECRSQKVQLQHDLDLMRKQKESRDHMIQEQQRELIEQRISLDDKDEEIENMRRDQANLNEQQIDLLERKMQVREEEVAAKDDQIQVLRRRIDSMRVEAESRKEMDRREEAEVAAQISQLRGYNKDLQRRVQSYELKIQSLLTKIESLKLEIEARVLDEQQVRDMEQRLRSSENMVQDKKNKIKELMDAMKKLTAPPPDFPTPRPILKSKNKVSEAEACDIFQMAAKLKKCQHQKRELIYQKNYLLKLVSGFHLTEAATLAFIAHMKEGVVPELDDEAPRLRPIAKFRAAVHAVIAISRMKFLVRRWAPPQKKVSISPPKEPSSKRSSGERVSLSCVREREHEVQSNSCVVIGSRHSPPVTRTSNRSPAINASTTVTFTKSKNQTFPKWVRVQGNEAAVEKTRASTDATVDDFFERIRRVHDDMNFSHSLSEVSSLF